MTTLARRNVFQINHDRLRASQKSKVRCTFSRLFALDFFSRQERLIGEHGYGDDAKHQTRILKAKQEKKKGNIKPPTFDLPEETRM